MAVMADNRGFTLLELLIVVTIIGLLSMIAIPNFIEMQKRARTSEARSNLGTIWVLQEVYHAESGSYARPSGDLEPAQYDGTTGWTEIGFYPKGTTRYEYKILSANYTTFQARAKGNIDIDSDYDIWKIDEQGSLVHIEYD
jgi:prepilin-type N-terminal cleavage/methylation domain-containing protein